MPVSSALVKTTLTRRPGTGFSHSRMAFTMAAAVPVALSPAPFVYPYLTWSNAVRTPWMRKYRTSIHRAHGTRRGAHMKSAQN